MVAYTDTVPGLLKQIADQGNGGVDSTGTALPSNFDSLGSNTTTTWDGFFPLVATTVVVSGSDTYTQTVTYSNDGTNITGELTSKWVKS